MAGSRPAFLSGKAAIPKRSGPHRPRHGPNPPHSAHLQHPTARAETRGSTRGDTIANAAVLYDIAAVQQADPLFADRLLARLPDINEKGDGQELISLLRTLSDRALLQYSDHLPSAPHGLAVMRDLGIVLGSLKRHRIEPLDVVPELTPLLLALGRQADLVPRDTVEHYTSWNPTDGRRRTYTNDEQEQWLQDAVRRVFPELSASLAITENLVRLDPRDARFAPTAAQLTGTVQPMLETIDSVTARVSPVFFAQVLRPYFEEITVDGREYLGPAAAQVPLWLVDLCIWASDRSSAAYEAFLDDSLQYALPDWRGFYERYRDAPSLVTQISVLLTQPEIARSSVLHESAAALSRLLRVLKTFRGRHIRIAKQAYSEEVRLYETGSGGAPVALLQEILDLTRANEKLLDLQGSKKKAVEAA
jgi:hypothetical protein